MTAVTAVPIIAKQFSHHVLFVASGRVSSMTINSEFSAKSAIAGIATPSRTRRTVTKRGQRKIKLFRKKTFLVNDSSKSLEVNSDAEMSEQENNNKADKLRIVQFSSETALSKSIRRKAKLEGICFCFARKLVLKAIIVLRFIARRGQATITRPLTVGSKSAL